MTEPLTAPAPASTRESSNPSNDRRADSPMGKSRNATNVNSEQRRKKSPPPAARLSREEWIARGKSLRQVCPRGSHAAWEPAAGRPDPVRLVEVSNEGRLPELIPLRHGRMLQSPFTFYRGAALNMAVDLSSTPATGIRVQACGDAHLGNFRCFATPERRVIFDIHDLDETLPAPWEWDVKRLAASFVLACRTAGLGEEQAREAVLTCARAYRERMAEFSQMRAVEVWYATYEADRLIANVECAEARARKQKRLDKAKGLCVFEDDFPKLADTSAGKPTLKDTPPVTFHHLGQGKEEFYEAMAAAFALYRESLPDERRLLLDRYHLEDLAIRVVGVGSVGTVCGVALLMAGEQDPLFLQLKEARPSVLEAFAGRSLYANHGQRVVTGHRLMQSASDIFLGWTGGAGRHYYVRQLRDVKVKFPVEQFRSAEMAQFAEWCGATLARAHARSGEPALISGYLGKADTFDVAMASFAVAYADQSERDHERMKEAEREGRLVARADSEG